MPFAFAAMFSGPEAAAVASGAAESEASAGEALAALVVLAVIAVPIVLIARAVSASKTKRTADHVADRVAYATDVLNSEGDTPRYVLPARVDVGVNDWAQRTVALTAKHLVVFDHFGGGRLTIRLADVLTSGSSHGALSVALSSGASYRFALPPDWLDLLEKDIRQLVAWNRNGGSGGTGQSVADELGKLAALRDSGALAAADWERAKDLFLGKGEDARDRAARELRQIHELNRSGVLSDSEFNMKKWDILARTG